MNSMLDPTGPYTLEPPGSILIVGAGLLGIEAGLYGRFLGYDIQIIEQDTIGSKLRARAEEELPVMPNRCLSPLAVSALQAQSGSEVPPVPPLNFGQWIDQMLVPITESDLLHGRVHTGVRVTKIQQIPADPTSDDETSIEDDDLGDDDVPPDFRLIAQDADATQLTFDAEAVILAVGGPPHSIQLEFTPPVAYFHSIGESNSDDWETDLRKGWQEITAVFAELGDRADLDLYRPRRL
ncbi:MAG: hypothetical protein AAGG48_08815 [Planctomycetota bacterium]